MIDGDVLRPCPCGGAKMLALHGSPKRDEANSDRQRDGGENVVKRKRQPEVEKDCSKDGGGYPECEEASQKHCIHSFMAGHVMGGFANPRVLKGGPHPGIPGGTAVGTGCGVEGVDEDVRFEISE